MVVCLLEDTLMQVWNKIDKKQEQILSQLEIPARSEIYDTPASTSNLTEQKDYRIT